MGTQIKNYSGARPVRILIVSQVYRNWRGFENIDLNVAEIDDLFARKKHDYGKEFEDKFIKDKFFDVQNSDFRELTDKISSGEYDIIHFLMHAHDGRVFFTETDLISYERFISAFEYIHRTEVVILNICNSARIAERIAAKVPLVLGWEGEGRLPEEKARETSASFYTPLFNGIPASECFKKLNEKKEVDCKIFMNSIVPDDKKKTLKKFLPALIIMLALILLVLSAIFFMKNRKQMSPTSEIDSLQIISPESGANVVQRTDFVISAKLRPGGIPWIFVLPPPGTEWWPQFQGHLTGNGNWEIPVQTGNAIDSGQFTIVAMVIKDQIADEMKAWLASQGTQNQSDPLSNETLEKFFWYAADTIIVSRVIE